jgi:hypothetical protein
LRNALAAVGSTAVLLTAAGCTTYHETQPPQSATQQLLESHAAEIAADRLAADLPRASAVFVDATHLKGDGSDYALAAIEASLLRHGMILTPDQKGSKITLAVRMGALSMDQKDTVFGLPAGSVPIPGTVTAFPIPEISFYSTYLRVGKAEFAAVAYDTATGAPIAFSGPVGGERRLVQRRYLTFFGGGHRLEAPADDGAN